MIGKHGVRAGRMSNKKRIARERILKGKSSETLLNAIFFTNHLLFLYLT
jgi:hypothetical protein